jgi:maleylacetate reductase
VTPSTVTYDFARTQRVRAGAAVEQALSDELHQLGCQRAFVIGSRSVLEGGLADRLRASLGERLVGIHTGIAAHGPQEDVLKAVLAARSAQADVLISIGGGTPIDAAKVAQAALTHGVHTLDELRALALPTPNSPSNLDHQRVGSIRNIAVPTTLSGAEFASLGGALNTELRQKQGYNHPDLAPVAIVFDPTLAAATPPRLWFSAAVRTLDHGVEGYLSPDAYPILQEQFLNGLRLMSRGLRAAHAALAAGDALAADEARWLSFQGVWAVSPALGRVRFGASHGLGYILGARHGVPHGETSCVLLAAVMQWNAEQLGERMAPIAQALDAHAENTPAHEVVRRLVQSMALPARLADVGVAEADFAAIAEAAAAHPVVLANPRAITGADDVMAVLRLAA